MNLPGEQPNDRRTVPRHLRDSEHGMSGEIPGFGARASDAPGGRALGVILSLFALGGAAAALWFWLA